MNKSGSEERGKGSVQPALYKLVKERMVNEGGLTDFVFLNKLLTFDRMKTHQSSCSTITTAHADAEEM